MWTTIMCMCRSCVACMRNAREIRVVSFSRSYAVITLTIVAKGKDEEEEEWKEDEEKEEKRERKDLSSMFSLVLVLKIILIVFSANDALVSKITNKRKEINSFRSFNLRDVLDNAYPTRPSRESPSFSSSSPFYQMGHECFCRRVLRIFSFNIRRARRL